ncbi:MAG: hypothetical protein IPM46_05560 [Flavobacteriales bacterium]|nr:hypothetical protein [Flavobacteriales bacterium]
MNAIADAFELANGAPMMLTMAPETAYVQGGQGAFGGIWGAYLPLIHALRDRIDILQVQLYNSGSMYGIDGGIYTQSTADFIVSQTEALLQGFPTNGGFFEPLPQGKVAIGLPACPLAAGGGYVAPAVIAAAVDYLRGDGPQPGTYTRMDAYPGLRGLMTWSINWDAAAVCAGSYTYAEAFEDVFGVSTNLETWDEPEAFSAAATRDGLVLVGAPIGSGVRILDGLGRVLMETRWTGQPMPLRQLGSGIHLVECVSVDQRRVARVVIP